MQLLRKPEKMQLKMLRMKKKSKLPTVKYQLVKRAKLMVKMLEMKVVSDKRKYLLLPTLPILRQILFLK